MAWTLSLLRLWQISRTCPRPNPNLAWQRFAMLTFVFTKLSASLWLPRLRCNR